LLRDIPFDELKVDRGFVHDACRDASLRAIFEASLGMARRLGMKTVAEGVEDQADWDFVRAAGCDLAQGYFIARPMPGADLAGWMADWDAHRLAASPPAQNRAGSCYARSSIRRCLYRSGAGRPGF
jgi:EAL domain-containing protein (putative c-di-GMP-specific phosphodiesterase class I)